MYSCAECGKPVLMIKDSPTRVCNHAGKAVVAALKATVNGQSRVNREAADGFQERSAASGGQ